MASQYIEMDSVNRITAGAIGKPGHRTFYLQVENNAERLTLLCEKEHITSLADATDKLLASLDRLEELPEAAVPGPDPENMAITEPVNPLFRVGVLAIGYDDDRKRVLLIAEEAMSEAGAQGPRRVRLFATRQQMKRMAAHAHREAARGRTPQQRALQQAAESRRNGHGE